MNLDLSERISNKACGKRYKVECRIENQPFWITGILINYNSGNLDLLTDDDCVIHIPYSGLRWLLPANKTATKHETVMSKEEMLELMRDEIR